MSCSLIFRLLAAASLGLLGACTTLGPDFNPPASPELQHWDERLYGLAMPGAREEAALETWWQVFHDPVLEQLIEVAKQNNLQLRQAGLRILQARALLGIAGAGLYPQSRLASGDLTYLNQQNHGGSGESSKDYVNFQAGLAVGWELDFWGKFRRGIESADAAFFASLEAQRAMQVLVNAQVASLYFSWRVLGERIGLAHKNAKLQKRSLEITTEQFHAGNTSELDLQQAKTQYLSTLATIPQLELQQQQTLNALALTLGRSPGDLPELGNGKYELPRIDTQVVSGIPSRLLLRRPDVHAAAWAVAAQSAQIGIAEADLYPALSLLGSLGWSSSTLAGMPDSGLLAIGPSLRWNIFDQGLIRNNVRLQDARLQETLAQYRQTVLAAAGEIDNAAISVVKTAEQEKILEQAVATAERALEIANINYLEGYTDFQRVLDAQRSLFTQNDRLASIRGENIAYLIALYKGIGGGWSPATLDDAVPPATRELMNRRTDWGGLLDQPLPRRLPSPVPEPVSSESP